jgi:hypothetical protein
VHPTPFISGTLFMNGKEETSSGTRPKAGWRLPGF